MFFSCEKKIWLFRGSDDSYLNFWYKTLFCNFVGRYQRFGGTYGLHLYGRNCRHPEGHKIKHVCLVNKTKYLRNFAGFMENLTAYRTFYFNIWDKNSYERTHIKVKTICHECPVKEHLSRAPGISRRPRAELKMRWSVLGLICLKC